MSEVVTTSPEETKTISRDLATSLRCGDCLLLIGDLGTGKTTFVQGVAEVLGAMKKATSPSFVVMQEYRIETVGCPSGAVLRHLDLYRLRDPRVDVSRIGLPELLRDAQAVTLVEWADRLPELPIQPLGRTLHVRFRYGPRPSERVIVLPEGGSL